MSADALSQVTRDLVASYATGISHNGVEDSCLPNRESIGRACHLLLSLLFPGFFTAERVASGQVEAHTALQVAQLNAILLDQTVQALSHDRCDGGETLRVEAIEERAHELVTTSLRDLPLVRELLATDVEAAYDNDPAAPNKEVIVVSYPCIEALAVQRFAHRLYHAGIPLLPRMMTEWAHGRTGIDMHPGAEIGEYFFIDHGTGVVIGETTRIGQHCVLYHGVTLGAWNPLMRGEDGDLKRGQSNKRHPDLEDHVTVYPGATILGGETVIGHHSVVGGNAWLTQSVQPYSLVTIKDPELNISTKKIRRSAASVDHG